MYYKVILKFLNTMWNDQIKPTKVSITSEFDNSHEECSRSAYLVTLKYNISQKKVILIPST
jgi:hypothetical protein